VDTPGAKAPCFTESSGAVEAALFQSSGCASLQFALV
jgi:hypothetical protein